MDLISESLWALKRRSGTKLPRPDQTSLGRSAFPIVSLRQFGWAAFLGIAAITLGGLGVAGLVGPSAYDFAGSLGRVVSTSIGVLGKTVLARLLWLAEHVPDYDDPTANW